MASRSLKIGLTAILVVAVIAGAMVALSYLGAKPGEKCEAGSDCQGGLICLNHRCRNECSSDADCPSSFSCRDTWVLRTTSGGFSKQKVDGSSVKICFSPEAMAQSPERLNAERNQQHQAQLDAIQKRQQVWNEVVKTTMMPGPGKPPPMKWSASDFDAAWTAIPETERRTASVPTLAARVTAGISAQQHSAPPSP